MCGAKVYRLLCAARAHGSAEQNIALHNAVMLKVEENDGKVPESMKH